MSSVVDMYLDGVAASLPFALYFFGIFMESPEGKAYSPLVRLFAIFIYFSFCLLSWLFVGVSLLVMVVDIWKGHRKDSGKNNVFGEEDWDDTGR